MLGKSLVFVLLGCAVASAIPVQGITKPSPQLKNLVNPLNTLLKNANDRIVKVFLETIQPFVKTYNSLEEATKNTEKYSIKIIEQLKSKFREFINKGKESFRKVGDAFGKFANQVQGAINGGIEAADNSIYNSKQALNILNQHYDQTVASATKELTQNLQQWKNQVEGFLENGKINSESEENNDELGLWPDISGDLFSPLTNAGEALNKIPGIASGAVNGIKEDFQLLPNSAEGLFPSKPGVIAAGLNHIEENVPKLPNIEGLSPVKLPNAGEVWNNITGTVAGGVNNTPGGMIGAMLPKFPGKLPIPKLPTLDPRMFEKIGQRIGGHIGGNVDKLKNTVGGFWNGAANLIGK